MTSGGGEACDGVGIYVESDAGSGPRTPTTTSADSPLRVRVESDGSVGARAEAIERGGRRPVRLVAANLWSYLGLARGNAVGDPVVIAPGYRGPVRVRLTDNDRYAVTP